MYRFAPLGSSVTALTSGLEILGPYAFSSDGQKLIYSNPGYSGAVGYRRGYIISKTWNGAEWATTSAITGTNPHNSTNDAQDNLYAGEILAASADFGVVAYSQRATDFDGLGPLAAADIYKYILRKEGASLFKIRLSGYDAAEVIISGTGSRLAIRFQEIAFPAKQRFEIYEQTTRIGEFHTLGIVTTNFSMSADGNHLFAGNKLFSWDGSDWVEADFMASNSAINATGTRVITRAGSAIAVYTKSGSLWVQTGSSFSASGSTSATKLWISQDGNRIAINSQLYTLAADWEPLATLPTDGTISTSGENAGAILSQKNLQAYELLENPFPFYIGSARGSAIYAGATEGKAIYSGTTLLWNVEGWTPPQAFTPQSVTGLRLWLDASLGLYDAATGGNPVTTAAPVLRWEDQSGNGNHATAVSSSAPSLALAQVNSLPGISFPSGGGKYFSLPNPLPSGGTGATIFVVTKPLQTGTDSGPLVGMIGTDTATWPDSHYPYRNSNIEDGFASTTRKTITPLPSNLFTWHLYNVVSGAGDWRYMLNGAAIFTTASNTYNGASFSSGTPKIGLTSARGTYTFRGTIAEILIYDTAINETDRQAISEYLRAKYNLWTP